MSATILQEVKDGLQARLPDVDNLLPGDRVFGKVYYCALPQGGRGESCPIDLETDLGSDFATGEAWLDIIDLAAQVWKNPLVLPP